MLVHFGSCSGCHFHDITWLWQSGGGETLVSDYLVQIALGKQTRGSIDTETVSLPNFLLGGLCQVAENGVWAEGTQTPKPKSLNFKSGHGAAVIQVIEFAVPGVPSTWELGLGLILGTECL